jgi:polysaccharide pyruvyl transferase WcaK-like protein/sulfatase maturation enzyme AslB (radical SAM superfamily)
MNIKSIAKTFSYLVKNKPYQLEKPIVLQFPVIDICNSQCQMCRIWENKKSDDISPEALRRGVRNPLYSEVASIGLNGGEPTLRKDLGKLAEVLFEELPKLRSISLITNAYKYEEVIARIIDVGSVVQRHGGKLDVMVSLDGYGEVHDKVRGKPGNFERAQKVIDFIRSSPLVASVRIGCTIIKENVYGLADLLEYCQDKGLYVKYRIGIPHQRLYTQNLIDPYALTPSEKYHIAEFMEGLITHYDTNEQQNFFYRSLIDQLVLDVPRKAGCDWQHRGATITSKGELLYCAVQSNVLGKIQDVDSNSAYFDNQPHLNEILESKCATCNHDYVGIPPKKEYAKQIATKIINKLQLTPVIKQVYRSSHVAAYRSRRSFNNRLAHMHGLASDVANTSDGNFDSPRRVLICGWYGTETLGDKAILGGVIHAIRHALGTVDITLVSLFPYVSEMTRRQMPDIKGFRIVNTKDGVRLAAGMDLVVFGGGPLMALNELADMEAIFGAARVREVPTLIAGCGVGPLGDEWHNTSLKNILLLASLRIYRDAKSRDLAKKLGIDTSADIVAEDPAFTWLYNQRDQINSNPPAENKVLLLGLRDFPYQTYARHLGETECIAAKIRYEIAVIQALESLVDRHPGLIIRPLPMCTNHFGDDDRWFYRRLFRGNVKLKDKLDLSLLISELAPIEYCEAFKAAHAALTMRFHSVVFALGLEVPTVAIDYTLGKGKVRSLCDRFGVPNQNIAELDANFIIDEIDKILNITPTQARGFEPEFTDALTQALPTLMTPKRKVAAL